MNYFIDRQSELPIVSQLPAPVRTSLITSSDRKSTALARRLRKSGCGAGTVIGVMVERTVDLLTVLLGILKAGAAYLPMDQTYPAARLKQMVSAADANLLITEPHLVSRLPRDHPPLLLDIEGASGTYADEEDMVACDAGEMLNRTAYLIFTSGSTGEPKGVEITHGGLTNLLWSMRQEPGIQPDDVLLAVTSICFDIAALELFLPLLVGARVELATTVEGRRSRVAADVVSRSREPRFCRLRQSLGEP